MYLTNIKKENDTNVGTNGKNSEFLKLYNHKKIIQDNLYINNDYFLKYGNNIADQNKHTWIKKLSLL